MINAHKSEAVADLRSFYGVSLWAVPMYELWHLVAMLLRDPTSRLHAASVGWEFPVSREWLALADLVDWQVGSKSKRKQKPYPRPFDTAGKRIGSQAEKRTPAELNALFASIEG